MAQQKFAFLQELIRRRVLRATGAYIVASWVIVQVASIVFPEFDAPWWAMRALIILLVAGFPIFALLAWTIDITAKGLQRTPDSHYSRTRGNALRFGVVAVATLMSAGALWWIWAGYIGPGTEQLTRSAIKRNPVIAVQTPRKLTGHDDIDWLGEGVANLVRDELAESSHVIVLSQARWNAIASQAGSDGDLQSIARESGIDYLVEGNYQPSPDGLVLSARVIDLANQTQIQGVRIEEADPAAIIAATSEISVEVKRALEIPLKENVERFAADFAVANMDAYEAYIAGLAYLADFDYQLAEDSFNAALELAPGFHMARYRLGMVMQATGHAEAAMLELDRIPGDADLTDRERLFIEGAKASFTAAQDPEKSIEIYSRLVELYPYDMEAGQHLGSAYWLDYREEEAIAEFRRLAELHSYDPSAWMALGERLLELGDHEEAEAALQKYVDMAPRDHYGLSLLGNLAQLRGDYARSVDYYHRSLELKPRFAVATLGLARSRYKQGAKDVAEQLWSELVADAEQAATYRIDAAFDLAGVLRGQRRFAELSELLFGVDALVREEGFRTAMMLSTLGITALDQDDFTRARTLISQAIAEFPSSGFATRYLFAQGLLELRLAEHGQLQNTISAIEAIALPPDDPDRTEDKAAAYLRGMSALAQDDLETAASALTAAVSMDGYEYNIYALGLAQLHIARGDLDAALAASEQAMTKNDPGDLRLDLELDRARARRLNADILAQMSTDAASRQP